MDKLGCICRQIGNLKSRAQLDFADNHPIKAIYTRRMNTSTQYLHRAMLEEQTANMMTQLEEDELEHAIWEVAVANGKYYAEMLQDSLLKEVLAII